MSELTKDLQCDENISLVAKVSTEFDVKDLELVMARLYIIWENISILSGG